ncbi:acetate/propionate family kinase [Lutimonas zeaxanthinifaciens]|uniref:acetate/propionate family kinase n=1 Tax=Lutimonas zeaxanthinifaciens TaxID=3060215 RepID=UPI00265D21C6|nr:acetate kinase [Lutimonas sp. YSD2104]WKK66887.1 acetate kinase [Lutimonas sp. YSD2104]
MKILVINSGSSSIKFQLIEMPEKNVLASGMVERIGLDQSKIKLSVSDENFEEIRNIPNHETGLQMIAGLLLDESVGLLKDADEIEAVGHRVVHGGSSFSKTVRIDNQVKSKIKELFSLAPLHNPHNFKGIEVAEKIFEKAAQIAVFDTAFHQTMPEEAYRYAIPDRFLKEEQIRAYGFHGTSHKYVSEKAINYLDKENSKIVTVHLGNGCSITAVKDGKSMEHSLGFGPMNGLVMGTRSGDIDQSVIFFLMEELGYTAGQVKKILQEDSGMLGLTGYSDLREIEEKAEQGDKNCLMALKMNAYRVKKYIGAYVAVMNGIDAVVFTAGIGENSDVIRKLVCDEMEYLGIKLDPEKNRIRAKELREIQAENEKVKILVIPTNEEIEIANQSYNLLSNM